MNERDFQPKSKQEEKDFFKEVSTNLEHARKLVKAGEAYEQIVRSENGEVKSIKVFNKNGVLIYFEDTEGLGKL